MKSMLGGKVRLALLFVIVVFLAGCGRRTETGTTDLRITLIPATEGVAGSNLTVQLADLSGAPVTDATVTLEGNMNHAGMAPVFSDAVTDEADGLADGSYRIPFVFTMLGDWIITVAVERPDGVKTTQNIDVTVGEAAVEVKGP
jgi:hypothetical protein